MRTFVDLHTHSAASDGQLAPEELVRLADAARLAAVALTDHDTTAGIAAAKAAARKFPELRFIAGIEMSAKFPAGMLHVLGLGIDEGCAGLQETLRQVRGAREERNPKIIAALGRLGMKISMEDVLAATASGGRREEGEIVGRLHIAEALRRKGYVRTAKEAFDRYIGNNGPAYVDKERLEPSEAIRAIREAGGAAVLAHPVQLRYENSAQLERILRSFISAGMNGIEVYHTDHRPEQTRLYLDLARRFGLLVTGGSDFHGPVRQDAVLGRPLVPLAALTGELAEKLLTGPAK